MTVSEIGCSCTFCSCVESRDVGLSVKDGSCSAASAALDIQ